MLSRFRSIIDRYPFVAFVYRSIRNAWIMQNQKPKVTPIGYRFMGRPDMQDGSFEPEETLVVKRYLNGCDVFIDVGANIGYYTCLSKSLGKYTVAVEPLSDNLLYLYVNLKGNGWDDSEVWPIGVGSQPGLKTLYGGSTGASLVKAWAGSAESYSRLIPISTLDIILGERFAKKSLLIKIDVEGAELKCFRERLKLWAGHPAPCG